MTSRPLPHHAVNRINTSLGCYYLYFHGPQFRAGHGVSIGSSLTSRPSNKQTTQKAENLIKTSLTNRNLESQINERSAVTANMYET